MNCYRPSYRLSNRQAKELLVRGQQLVIYLPCPAVPDPGDARDFARSSLDVEQHLVDDADWVDVAVQPGAGGEGLDGLLGQILTDEQAATRWHVTLVVCAATLIPPRCRGSIDRPQWPGSVIYGEYRFPRPGAEADREGDA